MSLFTLQDSQWIGQERFKVLERLDGNVSSMATQNQQNQDHLAELDGERAKKFEAIQNTAHVSTLMGMMANLKQLSIVAQLSISGIVRDTEKTFERVCEVNERYETLKLKVDNSQSLLKKSGGPYSKPNCVSRVYVRYEEPIQGRFNSATMPEGWIEQYQKSKGTPNFSNIDDFLLKHPMFNSFAKNYSNPEGIYTFWKERYQKQAKNEKNKDEMNTILNKKLQAGDVVTPVKKAKKITPNWQKFDKEGTKRVPRKETLYAESKAIIIADNSNSITNLERRKSSSAFRRSSERNINILGAIQQHETSQPAIISTPPQKLTIEEKMKPLLRKALTSSNINENDKIPPRPSVYEVTTSKSKTRQVLEIRSSLNTQSTVSNIPPPSNIPLPPTKTSGVPSSQRQTTSATENINSSTGLISELAGAQLKRMNSQKSILDNAQKQAENNTQVSDLLDSIRKGIKLSKASERVLSPKPEPKQAFDVFSVLKEKFKSVNSQSQSVMSDSDEEW